ncbi:MAG: hypothetical protein IAI50_00445 [Candidatus Eremiobacteraeota bacterium]|nr:hypothetical protein [Candidatus Eremiobacteraeota bacterium]
MLVATALWASASAENAPEHVLYNFQGTFDGGSPRGGLIANRYGAFYGTTQYGGGGCVIGCGTVFELVPSAGGGFTERVVHRFTGANDGTNPEAGVVADSTGALYGTTERGGSACSAPGCGTVYKLTPRPGGGYSESVIYAFAGGSSGENPISSVTLDSRGDLVGTAYGGSNNAGVVYELTRSGNSYTESILYAFGKQPTDGSSPAGAIVADLAGNLYGSTATGGADRAGTVYRLNPTANGYAETILYNFTGGHDGTDPSGALAFGPGGILYGTAYSGGFYHNAGVVYSLTPVSPNVYAEKTVHAFSTVGAEPEAGVYVDASGTLYGTTAFGGLPGCPNGGGCGIVYSLKPTAGGFAFAVLHVFGGGRDASEPLAGVVPGADGELYGTTFRGGTANDGTVYRIK